MSCSIEIRVRRIGQSSIAHGVLDHRVLRRRRRDRRRRGRGRIHGRHRPRPARDVTGA
jgi:hypothetical protein